MGESYKYVVKNDQCNFNASVGSATQRILIRLSYHSRDALVRAPEYSFVEYEDLQPLGCRAISDFDPQPGFPSDETTPLRCQLYVIAKQRTASNMQCMVVIRARVEQRSLSWGSVTNMWHTSKKITQCP